ncbi:MAG: hypothetical protein WAV00_02900 [Nocardioides sp.]
MQTIAIAVPLLSGRTESHRNELTSCWLGGRREAHQDSRRRAGIIREAVWIQTTPGGDLAVVLLDADDLDIALMVLETSDEPFDHWFRDHVRQVNGISWAEAVRSAQLALDFDTNRI